jgi:hypothetical protein
MPPLRGPAGACICRATSTGADGRRRLPRSRPLLLRQRSALGHGAAPGRPSARPGAEVVVLQRIRCMRDGCSRHVLLCLACTWGPIACSPKCTAAWRASQRAASSQRYCHSLAGRRTTARRVARWRAKRGPALSPEPSHFASAPPEPKNVTHAPARKLGPSTMVDPGAPAPSAAEADASEAHKETSHEPEEQRGAPARAERASAAQEGQGDLGERDAAAPERDGAAREQERCARCGRWKPRRWRGRPARASGSGRRRRERWRARRA